MIYVDSCIPMYLVGSDHPLKQRSIELVKNLLEAQEELIASAEVFQEIIHRYRTIRDLRFMSAAYEVLEELVSERCYVTKEDVDRARTLALQYESLSSRDCLHAAVMKRIDCNKIWTYDQGFDQIKSIRRVS